MNSSLRVTIYTFPSKNPLAWFAVQLQYLKYHAFVFTIVMCTNLRDRSNSRAFRTFQTTVCRSLITRKHRYLDRSLPLRPISPQTHGPAQQESIPWYVVASPALPLLARFPLLPSAADPLRTADHVGISTVRPSPARSSFPTGRGTRARRDPAHVRPHRALPVRACRHRLAQGRADGTAAGRRGPRQDPLDLALPHLRQQGPYTSPALPSCLMCASSNLGFPV